MAKANKSQLIKDYYAKNPRAGPTEVAEALKKHNISSAYVSNIKMKFNLGDQSRRRVARHDTVEAIIAAAEQHGSALVIE